MIDLQGRQIEYLRISVTDRCNFRCIYCMPKDAVDWVDHSDILRYEEITHLVRILAPMGIRKIRLTGGEPLVRANIAELVASLSAIDGIEEINLTTNGALLAPIAKELREAGLHGINFSLDTLRPEVFQKITRTGQFEDAMRGIQTALDLGFPSVKINCVPVAGINDDELSQVAALAKDAPIEVRFIELMPIGCGKNYTPVPLDQVQQQLSAVYGAPTPFQGKLGNGPAVYVTFPGFRGRIGFIGAMTHEFCDHCNRVRLTSEGFLKLCLHYNAGIDLKGPLRSGMSDDALYEHIYRAIQEKPDHHRFLEEVAASRAESHNMNAIGG